VSKSLVNHCVLCGVCVCDELDDLMEVIQPVV